MTTSDKILVCLQAENCTDAALGEMLHVPFLVTRAMCLRLERDGLVTHEDIAGVLPIWSLTESGKARAESLKQPA